MNVNADAVQNKDRVCGKTGIYFSLSNEYTRTQYEKHINDY